MRCYLSRRSCLALGAAAGTALALAPFAGTTVPSLTVTPNPALSGQTVDVSGSGFDPAYKFQLTTVDDLCREVGIATNINRPKRKGTFEVGIKVPPIHGFAWVRAYQRDKSPKPLAEALVRVT